MGNDERWYFTKEQLENSPSRQCGIDSQKEMHYRQQAATFIKDMGHKLNVSQLCMSTAIVYMHRFYVFHSFTHFPWHSIAAAALFLAAKVEEQPRKVEYVVKVAYMCKNHKELSLDQNADKCQVLFQDLVFNENILLQTLGFDVAIDHPHSHIVKCCHLVRAGKELAHTSYIMASNSLQITTMCLQYKPTVVACFCIHVACKWSQWEIPLSNEKKEWFSYVDPTVTAELLQQLTDEFLTVFDAYKVRLKHMPKSAASQSGSPFDHEPKPGEPLDIHRQSHHGEGKSGVVDEAHKYRGARPHEHGNMQQHREREYREKRERERLAQQQNGAKLPVHPGQSHKPGVPHHYHRSDAKQHSRPPMPGPSSSHSRQEPRDILREVTKDMGLRDPKREQNKDRSETIIRDMNRDHQHVRDKNMQKRDHLLKPNVTETNSVNNYQDSRLNFSADKQRVDALRSTTHVDPSKVPPKYDQIRRHDEVYVKNENEIKKHLNVSSSRDKNAAFLSKSAHSTSQKPKMPFTPDASKSVPKHNVVQTSSYNGSNSVSNAYNLPVVEDMKVKQDSKPETPIIHVKKPSLFSPEQTSPPKKISLPVKSSPVKQEPQTPSSPSISSFTSSASDQTVSSKKSNIPDAVLRPVMKKIDQVEGFQDIMKNPSSAVKLKVPDIITPIKDSKLDKPSLETQPCSFSKEMKPPDLIPPFSSAPPIVNGIETDAALISNLLKETPSVPHLPAVAATSVPSESKEKQHHHKEHKKKNKEKHKHKDKDRSKEEKEKKKKHKDKDREKHKKDKDRRHEDHQPPAAQPIKITIQKEKIHPVENSGSGLKIKISKDLITNDTIIEHPRIEQPQSSLKIKIPREIIDNYAPSESKKRERDRSSPSDAPPNKMPRSSSSKHSMEPKQNGRHSVNKVSNNNVTTSQYRPENVSVATTMFQGAPTGYYYYPNMQVPPPNLPMNPNMNMPPPNYVYPPYYGHGYVYSHPHEIYSHPIQTGSSIPPPLPADAPPDVPPPPPPE